MCKSYNELKRWLLSLSVGLGIVLVSTQGYALGGERTYNAANCGAQVWHCCASMQYDTETKPGWWNVPCGYFNTYSEAGELVGPRVSRENLHGPLLKGVGNCYSTTPRMTDTVQAGFWQMSGEMPFDWNCTFENLP